MMILKRLLDFYINASIHVALAVYAMTWITLIQFELPYDANVLYFVFYATITGYNFVKYFGIAKFHHRSLAGRLRAIQIFSFIAFIGMCYYGFQLRVKTLLFLSGFGLITFLYAIPILPMRYFRDSQMNLREISGMKIYVIALVWAFTTVILPFVDNGMALTMDVLLASLQCFLLVIVLMLPFEIRDLNYDSLKLGTIPQKIGIKNTKIIGVMLLMVFFFLEYFKDELTGNSILSMLIMLVLTLLLLVFSRKNQSRYYSAFWVESLPVIWLVSLLMLG
ncbi:hypothetical protein H7F21_15695 [Winogradskyella flava]|uniref:Prenyltransferase n=2 Tax=Winogradskyella flava TaxID=1884876 RepID=A0A842J0P9_9FLAO|nr:hypothetical protein [Winogradskyella flava]